MADVQGYLWMFAGGLLFFFFMVSRAGQGQKEKPIKSQNGQKAHCHKRQPPDSQQCFWKEVSFCKTLLV